MRISDWSSDVCSSDLARFVEERWMPLVRDRCIVVMTGMTYLAAERTSIGERLQLPMAETPDGPVTGVLGMAECAGVTGALPREARLSQRESPPVAPRSEHPR